MALPRVLKNMMLFNDGVAYIGEASSITLPTLSRTLEAWRGAGMDRAVKIDMGGGEDFDLEVTFGGPMRQILAQYGLQSVNGVMLRFAGAYQNDETGAVDSVEVTVRGRWGEIGRGDSTLGEAGEFTTTLACAYYREDWNGVTVIEDDPINMVLIVDGVDRLAAQRAALGI